MSEISPQNWLPHPLLSLKRKKPIPLLSKLNLRLKVSQMTPSLKKRPKILNRCNHCPSSCPKPREWRKGNHFFSSATGSNFREIRRSGAPLAATPDRLVVPTRRSISPETKLRSMKKKSSVCRRSRRSPLKRRSLHQTTSSPRCDSHCLTWDSSSLHRSTSG